MQRIFLLLITFIFITFYIYSEIIGYIDGIEAPRVVRQNQKYNFFKFYLNNGKGKRVQIVAWNDDVKMKVQIHQSNNVNIAFYFFLFIYFLFAFKYFYMITYINQLYYVFMKEKKLLN